MQTRTRKASRVSYKEESDRDGTSSDEGSKPRAVRKRAPSTRSAAGAASKRKAPAAPAPAPAPKEEEGAIDSATGRLLKNLFFEEEMHPSLRRKKAAPLKQSVLLDAFKVIREESSAASRRSKLEQPTIDASAIEEEVKGGDEEEASPTADMPDSGRRNVLLSKSVSLDDANRVGAHCDSLRKKYEEYSTREKEKKFRLIREADLPFLSDREIEMGLKDHNDNPDEFILHFITHPLYLRQLRERIAQTFGRSSTTLTDSELALHKRASRNSGRHAQRKAKVNTVARLALDEAIKQGVSDGWSEARKSAYAKIKQSPNAYYYRFNKPGEPQKTGGWSKAEKALFMERMKEIDIQCARPQWGTFSMVFVGRVGYQCANQYRKMVKDGEIDDPNYYVDEKGVLRHRSRDAKNGGEGGSELSGRKRTTRAKKPAKKRRKGADADTIFADDVSDGSESEKEPVVGFVSAKAAAAAAMEESSEDDSDEDDDNPLPDHIDPITLDVVERPAISPYGHVMGYDTWVRCLSFSEPKDRCPFTKNTLKLRQLVKLTKDNIHLYKDKIISSKLE